jgi:uncharacterized protein YyaL (SSP411 family)
MNQLKNETSPYLRQHMHNPVHWQKWGDHAFNLAQTSRKPILLSIGYAACHWCHVMAHESFEDPATANLMNELYVNIKVDREERPDIDSIYMTALAMMGQSGGWPLTMFLTPEGNPYWGGTYFPPVPRHGHPGFPDVLKNVSNFFLNQKGEIDHNIKAILTGLNQQAALHPAKTPNTLNIKKLNSAAERSLSVIDYKNGGRTGSPKFPQPSFQEFLWRAYLRTENKHFLDAVIISLTHMCQGGIYDHLGGGFSRYSTDAIWLAPHFEKMLYDNAQLILLATLVWQKTHSPLFKLRIEESVEWALRELKLKGGGFAGTLDADSLDKASVSREGAFYVWSENEIKTILGDSFSLFQKTYDISEDGNWEQTNILNRLNALELDNKEIETELKKSCQALFKVRNLRTRPKLDNKVLADWNGLMIAALSYASLVFNEPSWLVAAENAFTFITTNMAQGPRLSHSHCSGLTKNADILDDYAFMIKGALFLYQASGVSDYLNHAINWTETAEIYFGDPSGAGYYNSPSDAKNLIVRTLTLFDNATPSGNGVMAENLARLYYLTGETKYRNRADILINSFSAKAPDQEANMPSITAGFELLTSGIQVIIIANKIDATDLFNTALSIGNPNLIIMQLLPNSDLASTHPAYGKIQINGDPTAYVCRGQTCGLPHTRARDLLEELMLNQDKSCGGRELKE